MASQVTFGRTLSAVSTAAVCGALAFFIMSSIFPPQAEENLSYIGFISGLFGFAIGMYTGWRWARNLAESIVVELLIKTFLWVFAIIARQI